MKASIVVPTFNQGPFIQDCLVSIQNQTYRDFEVIIQDSLSTDQTEQVCRTFVEGDSRFHYFREKDGGQSDALNRGLARSVGPIWTWICSDDCYADNRALEKLLIPFAKTMGSDNQVMGVYGDAQYVSEDGNILGPYQNQTQNLKREDFKLNWPLAQPSLLLLREVVREAGGVDPSLYLGMDLDLFLKILKENRYFLYVAQMVVSIRLQPNSKSVRLQSRTAKNALQIVKKHFGEIGAPNESAYAREYGRSKRHEVTHALQELFSKMIPFRKGFQAKFLLLEEKATLYTKSSYQKRDADFYLVRSAWWICGFVRFNLFMRVKRAINYSLEMTFRAKNLLLKWKN